MICLQKTKELNKSWNNRNKTYTTYRFNTIQNRLDFTDPQSGNPNSILLSGFCKNLGRRINARSIRDVYSHYKKEFFPKLLNNPNVLPEDKQRNRELLKKPWNPYIRRHSSLTEKSTILNEHTLRQFAGWSPGSNMHLKYLHYFGNESNDSDEAYGIISKGEQLSEA